MSNTFSSILSSFFFSHQQFIVWLALLFIALMFLWHKQLISKKNIASVLIFFVISFVCLILAIIFTVFNIGSVSIVDNLGTLTLGLGIIRISGYFLFRIILPACRLDLLSIIEDLIEFAGYCLWLFIYLHELGLELSQIITTSAVMTAILAFAMQDTLGNIIGGLALQLDNSIKVGDWIKADDINGRVTDIRWRYTSIETRNWETIIVPNSLLMKGKLSIIGRRTAQPLQCRRWIYFDVGYQYSSTQVIETVQQAICHGRIKNVAKTPEPNCLLLDFTPHSIRYALRYWLIDIEQDDATDSIVRLRIRAALQRVNIDMPYPRLDIHLTNKDDNYRLNKKQKNIKEKIEALYQVALFSYLNDDEITEIAKQLVFTPFVQGDIIMRQGEIADWLYIIINGTVEILLEMADGESRHVDTLSTAGLLGEMGLMTGDPRSATAVAKTEVLAYRLDKLSFQKVLDARPEIAVEISKLLATRRFSIESLQKLDKDSAEELMKQAQTNFLNQIKKFFGL